MATDKQVMRSVHEPLQDGDELNTIADCLIEQFDDFETELNNMKLSVQIDTATGTDLENIAAIFGLSRDIGESDSDFRSRIKAFFPGTVGSGTIVEIKNTINRVTGISLSEIDITEIESAKFKVTFSIGPNFSLINTVKDIVWEIKSAGIYPFFDITSGVTDTTTVSDDVEILVTNRTYYGHFKWGASIW